MPIVTRQYLPGFVLATLIAYASHSQGGWTPLQELIIFAVTEAGGLIPLCCVCLYVLLSLVQRARLKLFNVFLVRLAAKGFKCITQAELRTGIAKTIEA